MFRYILIAVALAQLSCVYSGEPSHVLPQETKLSPEDLELVLAYTVNRHGARTPDEDELSLSNEKEKFQEYIKVYGYEGLINAGKRSVYYLGKFLKSRYGYEGAKLLSQIYYNREIALRSTDKERTKMTAEIAMSALYPPVAEQQWIDGLGQIWQPVPYTAVPLSEDYLRYYSNCKEFKNLMATAKKESVYHELAPYNDLVDLIKENTGRNFTEDPTMFQTLHDLFRSQAALGFTIPEWAKPVMPRLAEAAKLAYRLYFRTEPMKKIGGGVILNDFVQDAKNIAEGKHVDKRYHMYSSHDFNVGALMEVTKVQERENIVPEYASMFGIELYKNKRTGKYYVLPIFLPHADEKNEFELLHFEACKGEYFCEFEKFLASTQQYLFPEKEFYQTCGINTELAN